LDQQLKSYGGVRFQLAAMLARLIARYVPNRYKGAEVGRHSASFRGQCA
jgi:hypothetical protein